MSRMAGDSLEPLVPCTPTELHEEMLDAGHSQQALFAPKTPFTQMRPATLAATRATLLKLAAWLVGSRMLPTPPAAAATIMSVCSSLDDERAVRNLDDFHEFDVSVGAPGFDSWCAVTVRVKTDDIEYLWLKDASTPKTRRIFAAKQFPIKGGASTVAELTQQLKVGYRVKPLSFCSSHGLYEGEPFTVGSATGGRVPLAVSTGSRHRTGSVVMAAPTGSMLAEADVVRTLGLILVAYVSGYASEGYEPHKL